MKPLGLSSYALARALKVPPPRIHDLILEKRGISTDTARRLAAYFNTSVELWMGLQDDYELEVARELISDQELKELVKSDLS